MGRKPHENLSIRIGDKDFPVTTMNLRGDTVYVYWRPNRGHRRKLRIYGRTLDELKEKVIADAFLYEKELYSLMPKGAPLYESMCFYLMNCCYDVSPKTTKERIILASNIIKGSELDVPYKEITEAKLRSFYRKISLKYDISSIMSLHEAIQDTFAFYGKYNEFIPCIGDISIQECCSENLDYILSPSETDRVIQYCLNKKNISGGNCYALIAFSMMSGIQLAPLSMVTYDDIDFEAKTITYAKRSDGPKRVVTLQEDGYQLLLELRDNRESDSIKLVFHSLNENTPIRHSSRQIACIAVLRGCGLPVALSIEALRKSAIIRLIEKGVSLQELSKNLGFRSANVVENIYDEYKLQQQFISSV